MNALFGHSVLHESSKKKRKKKKKKRKRKRKRKSKKEKKKKRKIKPSVLKPVIPPPGYQAPAPTCIDGWTDGWMDGCMDGRMEYFLRSKKPCFSRISRKIKNIFFWLFLLPLVEFLTQLL